MSSNNPPSTAASVPQPAPTSAPTATAQASPVQAPCAAPTPTSTLAPTHNPTELIRKYRSNTEMLAAWKNLRDYWALLMDDALPGVMMPLGISSGVARQMKDHLVARVHELEGMTDLDQIMAQATIVVCQEAPASVPTPARAAGTRLKPGARLKPKLVPMSGSKPTPAPVVKPAPVPAPAGVKSKKRS